MITPDLRGGTLPDLMACLNVGPEIDWDPRHLADSHWVEHVPFAFWLVKGLQPRILVELGAGNSVSHAAFCQAIERLGLPATCYAITPGVAESPAIARGAGAIASLAGMNARWREFSSVVQAESTESRAAFGPASVDLLHLDGLRSYKAIAEKFALWRDALSNRAVVLVHDINNRQSELGIGRFWRELAAAMPHFEFPHGHGLGVLGVGPDQPPPLRALFAAGLDQSGLALARGLFGARGRAVADRYYRRQAEAALQGEWPPSTPEPTLLTEISEARDPAHDTVQTLRQENAGLLARLRASETVAEDLKASEDALLHERAAMARVRHQHDLLLASNSWRLTRPLRIAKRLLHGDRAVLAQALRLPFGGAGAERGSNGASGARLPTELIAERMPNLRPLTCFPEPAAPARLTMLTDSNDAGSLFGGVGTAMILSALMAQRLDVPLRIVTRDSEPVPGNFATVLQAQGISHPANVEFLYVPTRSGGAGLPMGPRDLLLTTSWWTTWSAMRGFDPARIVYLIQEDERMFYPAGDEQLLCRDVLGDTRIRFVVNTHALRDHLIGAGLAGIAADSVAFEPAFPATIYHPQAQPAGSKRGFFLYARPHNPRNLFLRATEALAAAIERDVLRPEDWIFHIVGNNIPQLALPGGAVVNYAANLPWPDYAALIRTIDVGLSLMYTPHPSYPPLDLAASGAVVVTNRYGSKMSLDRYCRNILCADPDVDSLVAAIDEAVKLADDIPRRTANLREAGIARDWATSFAPVLDRLAG